MNLMPIYSETLLAFFHVDKGLQKIIWLCTPFNEKTIPPPPTFQWYLANLGVFLEIVSTHETHLSYCVRKLQALLEKAGKAILNDVAITGFHKEKTKKFFLWQFIFFRYAMVAENTISTITQFHGGHCKMYSWRKVKLCRNTWKTSSRIPRLWKKKIRLLYLWCLSRSSLYLDT